MTVDQDEHFKAPFLFLSNDGNTLASQRRVGMRGDHQSDAHRLMGDFLREMVDLTIGCVTAILLVSLYSIGLPVFDLIFVALYVTRRMSLRRSALCAVGLLVLAVVMTPPICSGGREHAYAAAIKSDLKNLASQEEIYYAEHHAYTSSFPDLEFVHSDGVSIVLYASPTGWMAWATHVALEPSQGCVLSYGDAPALPLAEVRSQVPGQMVCTM